MDSQSSTGVTEFETSRGNSRSKRILRGYADLALVLVLALATVWLALAYGEQGGPAWARVPLGFIFVFVLPGYALTAALFPRRDVAPVHSSYSFSIGGVERLVLSVGLSLAIVPLVSISLSLLSVPIALTSVIGSLGGLILVTTLVAAARTYSSPPQERFSLPLGWLRRGNGAGVSWNKFTVSFALILLLAGAGLTAAIVGSGDGDTFSELAIHSPDEDGELLAAEYPDSLTLDESETLHVEIENQEQRSVEYTVVVLLDSVDSSDGVVDRNELDRFHVELDHGDRTVVEHELEPTRTGESLRVSYLLYVDGAPDQPSLSNADTTVHFFTDVDE